MQSIHAAIEFCHEYPEIAKDWHVKSNSICLLEVNDLDELNKVIDKLKSKNIKYSLFKEPDFNNELTSIAIEPGSKSKKFCFNFKLGLRSNE